MERNQYSATEQPDPVLNDKPACWDLVIQDMKDRDQWGRSKYRVPLQAFNGRNAIVDFYQEQLDGTVYCRQLIEEIDYIKVTIESLLLITDFDRLKTELQSLHLLMA